MNVCLDSTAASSDVKSVWDRLWLQPTSPDKDDRLLDRERRSPRWSLIVDRIESQFGGIRGLRTVELGSGRGDLSALLAERGAEVTLLDASGRALSQAESRFTRCNLRVSTVHADLFHWPTASPGRFDVALSSGVIEHFTGEDRTRAVQAHADAVREGGLVVISVPHARCLPYRLWKLYLEARGCWPFGLEIPYTRGELRRRGRAAGLDEIESPATGLWQSVGDHWFRGVFGKQVDWVDRRSRLDRIMGLSLILLGRKHVAPVDS